jgi:ankyrin repeat protein
MVEWLLSHGSSLAENDNTGMTALHCAAVKVHGLVVKFILSHGSRINSGDKEAIEFVNHFMDVLNNVKYKPYFM